MACSRWGVVVWPALGCETMCSIQCCRNVYNAFSKPKRRKSCAILRALLRAVCFCRSARELASKSGPLFLEPKIRRVGPTLPLRYLGCKSGATSLTLGSYKSANGGRIKLRTGRYTVAGRALSVSAACLITSFTSSKSCFTSYTEAWPSVCTYRPETCNLLLGRQVTSCDHCSPLAKN